MIRNPAARPLIAVLGGVLLFALLIERAGLLPAVLACVFVASRGSPDTTAREALVFGILLAVAMSLLFVGALGQSIAIVRGF